MPKTREMTFKDASAALIAADTALQTATTKDAKRKAALEFYVAERDARSAKLRESNAGVMDVLNGAAAHK